MAAPQGSSPADRDLRDRVRRPVAQWVAWIDARQKSAVTFAREKYEWVGRRPDWWHAYYPALDRYVLPLLENAGWADVEEFEERAARKYHGWDPPPPDSTWLEGWLESAEKRRLVERAPDEIGVWGVTDLGRKRMAPLGRWWARLVGGIGIGGGVLGLIVLLGGPKQGFDVPTIAFWIAWCLLVGAGILFLFELKRWLNTWSLTPVAWERAGRDRWPPGWPDDRRKPRTSRSMEE